MWKWERAWVSKWKCDCGGYNIQIVMQECENKRVFEWGWSGAHEDDKQSDWPYDRLTEFKINLKKTPYAWNFRMKLKPKNKTP